MSKKAILIRRDDKFSREVTLAQSAPSKAGLSRQLYLAVSESTPVSQKPYESTLICVGEQFTVQASTAELRRHLTNAYWHKTVEQICEGRQVVVAVRYTGEDLMLVQYLSPQLCRSGRRYPVSLSIPVQYLVPVQVKKLAHSYESEEEQSPAVAQEGPQLCVVCGKWGVRGEVRPNGYKCSSCIGLKSSTRLRNEYQRLKEEQQEQKAET